MTDVGAEIFDLVDATDQVIGQATRAEVHRRMLRHRAVHILAFNRAGQVFIQKRSAIKDMHPNVWDSSASGHVDSGEDYDFAATREIREELGIDATPARQFKIDAGPETDMEFVWVYRIETEGPFTLHPEEIDEGRWITPQELTDWICKSPEDFAPAFAYLWTKYNERQDRE